MLQLFLFSDHNEPECLPLDQRVLRATCKAAPSVAWVPSGSPPEKTEQFFANRKASYASLGIDNVQMFPLNYGFREDTHETLLSSDIVHLSGGNPYTFLQNLRSTRVFDTLRARAANGGILVGDSAGAMLMTPSIEICSFDSIPVPDGMTDFSALGLVDFEIHPHWGSYGAGKPELEIYARSKGRTILCIPDGSGVSVVGDKWEPFGEITVVN